MPLGIVEQHTCQDNRNDRELWLSYIAVPGAEVYASGLGHGITSSDVLRILQRAIARKYGLSGIVWPEEK